MKIKRLFLAILLLALMGSLFIFTGQASAAGTCGSTYSVARNDTLRKIAALCDTTVSALQRANPEIGNGELIYPKQVLLLPGAVVDAPNGTDIYIIAEGDTIKSLAAKFNQTTDVLLAWNPDISNANIIYEGQRLVVRGGGKIPGPVSGSGHTYIVQRGDTLRMIAARFNTSLTEILKLNPQIHNANLIYNGQSINVPRGPGTYVVQRGDTLKKITLRFGINYATLLALNPQIYNPNLIYVGQVIILR